MSACIKTRYLIHHIFRYLFVFIVLTATMASCTKSDLGPKDDEPNFELWYTMNGKEYHVKKNLRRTSFLDEMRRNKLPLEEYPYEELNPCSGPEFFKDRSGKCIFSWKLQNPIYFSIEAVNDTAYHYVTSKPYPLFCQDVHFAKGYAPIILKYPGDPLELLDSLSFFKFAKNDSDGLYISFELALKYVNDTIYIRDGYVEAHPNRKGFFVWDVSNHIYDE